ncbi:MAG: hypothetical protein EXS50_00755 [Candidatus Taylorbacteria bacterium]|nr:hypothetical protein [Candidatus Taylorbacteria bacterium]
MPKKSSILSPQYAKKKRQRLIGRLVLIFVALVLLLFGIYYLAHTRVLRIKNIEVSGSGVIPEKNIIDVANDAMNGNYMLLFPKDGLFFFPGEEIQKMILAHYPVLNMVNVDTYDWNMLKITLGERKPNAVWCNGLPMESEDCYFLDDTGFIFTKAPAFSSNVYFKYYGSTTISVASTTIGTTYPASREFRQIDELIKSIKNFSVPIVALYVDQNRQFELTIQNSDTQYGKIFFNDQQPFEKTLENLSTIWKEKKNFKYVDLRYGNKVYFKLQ